MSARHRRRRIAATALVGSGAKSNAYSPLLLRLQRCERVRGLVPNIVGVDFYDQGKVLAAVNVINGLPANAKPALPTR